LQQYRDQKDAILFLIHVSPTMVKAAPDEGTSALKTALECAYDLLLQKIISNPSDMMGILLFGTVTPTNCPLIGRRKQKSKGTIPIYTILWTWTFRTPLE
jgi:hypothetical protein